MKNTHRHLSLFCLQNNLSFCFLEKRRCFVEGGGNIEGGNFHEDEKEKHPPHHQMENGGHRSHERLDNQNVGPENEDRRGKVGETLKMARGAAEKDADEFYKRGEHKAGEVYRRLDQMGKNLGDSTAIEELRSKFGGAVRRHGERVEGIKEKAKRNLDTVDLEIGLHREKEWGHHNKPENVMKAAATEGKAKELLQNEKDQTVEKAIAQLEKQGVDLTSMDNDAAMEKMTLLNLHGILEALKLPPNTPPTEAINTLRVYQEEKQKQADQIAGLSETAQESIAQLA